MSQDRELRRRLAWTVDEFGYNRTASGDWSPAALWRRPVGSEVWLLDARDPAAADTIAAVAQSHGLHVVALAPRDASSQHEELLRAGADDVLLLPLDDAELAARLRAGVRHLEFKHRLARRAARDPATGLLTRNGLISWAMSAAPRGGVRKNGLVSVFQVEGVARIRASLGAETAAAIHEELATTLRRVAEDGAKGVAAQLEEDVFAIAMPDGDAERGAALAAKVISDFRASQTVADRLSAPPAVSAVVGDWASSWAPSTVLASLVEAVEQAPLCSDQPVVTVETINAMRSEWANAEPRRPALDRALAGQVAEPLPVVLRVGELASVATAWSGLAAGALPPVTPVVDDTGSLIGVFDTRFKDALADQPLGPEMVAPADDTIAHDAPVGDLLSVLERRAPQGVVVVDGERPVGYLTDASLRTLLAPRHGAASYRQRDACSQLQGLIVPSGGASVTAAVAG